MKHNYLKVDFILFLKKYFFIYLLKFEIYTWRNFQKE